MKKRMLGAALTIAFLISSISVRFYLVGAESNQNNSVDYYILDDMDYETYEDAKEFWNPENFNQNGEGAVGSLETDPENVAGGKGKSLKMVYDKSKTNWNSAGFVHMND